MILHRGGGADPHRLADFPQGGGVPLPAGEGADEVVDPLLFGGEVGHGAALPTASSLVGGIVPYPGEEVKQMFEKPPWNRRVRGGGRPPLAQVVQDGDEGLAPLREAVLHLGGDLGVLLPMDQLVASSSLQGALRVL